MATETIRTHRAYSKTARAKDIFTQMMGFPRSAVVKRYENELGLSPAGASTYFQSVRKELGLVNSRA